MVGRFFYTVKNAMLCAFLCALFCSFPVYADMQTGGEDIVLIEPQQIEKKDSFAVLSPQDAEKYAEAFSLLDEGEVAAAKQAAEGIQDKLLAGYLSGRAILAQPKRKPTQKEIEGWLKKYKDQPIASQVYEFAMRKDVHVTMRRPKDASAHLSSGACTSVHIPDPMDYVFFKKVPYVPAEHRKSVRKSMLFFSAALRNGKTLAGKLHLNDKKVRKYISRKDYEESLTALAFAYFIDGEDAKALQTLKPVLERKENALLLAHWTAGLVSWRQKNYEAAQTHFQTIADSEKAKPVFRAAGAFWTTRALIKNGRYYAVSPYLRQAAQVAPYSVYGILARRALGWDIEQNWKKTPLSSYDEKAILQTAAGKRALAFFQIDLVEEAEQELIHLYARRPDMRKTLIAFARNLPQAPDLDARLAALTGEIETVSGKKELYPFPNWTPLNGWKVDKALVYAFVRQESCFKNKAFSKAGARGVMQLMPSTARLMSRKLGENYRLSKLHRIPYNLMVGQELVLTLLNRSDAQGNLMAVIAAYNCGTRNLKRWNKRADFQNDPLFFMEAIPSRETRGFVKKVLANYWVYRSLFGKSLESVDEVLAGEYPTYRP